jgi:hypothetical protein
VSSVDPAGSLAAHNGSTTADIASIASGNALPTTNAQARPAITAMYNGRVSILACDVSDIPNIDASLSSYPMP